MLVSLATLILAALASASPLSRRIPPPTSISKGFHLVANVTGATDLSPPINGWTVEVIDIVSGEGRAVLLPGPGQKVFYQNGTADEIKYRHACLASDDGVIAAGLQIDYSDLASPLHPAWLRMGSGSMNFMLGDDREPFSFVDPLEYSGAPNSFVACRESIATTSRPDATDQVTISFLTGSTDAGGQWSLVVPDHCIAVNLVPQCAALEDLPSWVEASSQLASHKYAQDSRCYVDVSSVAWSS